MASTALVLAGLLSAVIASVHSWLGEARLIGPLLDPATRTGLLAKSEFARNVLRFAWHLTSIAWIGIGATFLAFAHYAAATMNSGERAGLAALVATMATTGAVICASSRGRHLAWPVFAIIAAFTAYAAWA